jgi:hypothetical protein
MNRLAIVAVLALFSSPLRGSTLLVSTSGTYSSATPSSSWTAPLENWSFSFDISSTPSVSQVTDGSSTTAGGFDPVISNFVYKLNGTPVNVAAVETFYFDTDYGGLITICFFGCNLDVASYTPVNGFIFYGNQAYSGSESAPTILAALLAETNDGGNPGNELIVSGTQYNQTNGSIDTTTTNAVPEPFTMKLNAAGLLMLAAVGLKRKRRAASAA